MTTEIAIIALGVAIISGELIIAIAIFSLSKTLKKTNHLIDEIRYISGSLIESSSKFCEQYIETEKKRLTLESASVKPRLHLLKGSNLKIYEDKQELSVGYKLENLGEGRVLIKKLQVALINRRTPSLIKLIDILFNMAIGGGKSFEKEVIVSARDFTRVSLPFVPDFDFIRDSCEIVASCEFEDVFGESYTLTKNILEW